MTAPVLRVTGLGKAFRSYRSEWQRVASWFGARPRASAEHWALRDVSFTVEPGEVFGIVGQNGAGKSTLLKLIAGTLHPTEGAVAAAGRIAAILELGMGFNPEFTGRANVLHTGGLMGFDRATIDAAMGEIESFADIGEYFDEPLRTSSSGMQMRVAFALATALRPRLLIIDEALAVGDAAFQRKCFRRIEAFRAAGTSVLFVSHDTETVRKLCARALLLQHGRVAMIGVAKDVCDEYERQLFGSEPVIAPAAAGPSSFDPGLAATDCALTYGDGRAEILSCRIETRSGALVNVVAAGEPFVWRYSVRFATTVVDPVFAMMLKTREGAALYGVDSSHLGQPPRTYHAGEVADVRFELANCLAPGVYYLNCGVRTRDAERAEFLVRRVDAALVRIAPAPGTEGIIGTTDLRAVLTTQSVAGEGETQ